MLSVFAIGYVFSRVRFRALGPLVTPFTPLHFPAGNDSWTHLKAQTKTDTCTCNFQGQNIQAYLYQMAMEAIVFTVHQLRSNRSFLQRTRSLQNWRISVVYSPVLAGAYSAV